MLGGGNERAEVLNALARAIDGIGAPGHLERLIDLIGALVAHDKVTVVRYSASKRPEFVSWRNYSEAMVRRYLETYYRFDPFYADWRHNRRPGVVALAGSGRARTSPYVSEFLGDSVICDELGVMLEDGGDWCIGIFLDRSTRPFPREALTVLKRRFPVFAALHRQDIRLRGPSFRRTAQPVVKGSEPGAIGEIPDDLWLELTAREREIAALILTGHPTAGIARRLSISAGTVKNHRRNIYAKLDITTERELFLQYIWKLSR